MKHLTVYLLNELLWKHIFLKLETIANLITKHPNVRTLNRYIGRYTNFVCQYLNYFQVRCTQDKSNEISQAVHIFNKKIVTNFLKQHLGSTYLIFWPPKIRDHFFQSFVPQTMQLQIIQQQFFCHFKNLLTWTWNQLSEEKDKNEVEINSYLNDKS